MDLAEANKLAEANLPLCRFIANRWTAWGRYRGFDYEDLFGMAQLAMVRASRSYDPQQGPFGNWASWHIQSAFRAAGFRKRPGELSDNDTLWLQAAETEPLVPLEWADCWRDLLSLLDDRERAVIEMRFLDGLTLEETGQRISRTKERARQIEQKALDKLRRMGQCSPRRARLAHQEVAA